jgi:hypothetical protein
MPDYIAICLIGGGSSYGRDSSKDKAIAVCKRHMEQDWSQLFDLHGKEAKINVYDITGHDSVFWDYRGIHPNNDPEKTIDRLELVSVTLNVPKKLRKKPLKNQA